MPKRKHIGDVTKPPKNSKGDTHWIGGNPIPKSK